MKKVIITVIGCGLLVAIATLASANVLKKQSDVFVSSDIKIRNVSILVANTSYPVTFETGGVASFNLQARGADIRISTNEALASAKWTIVQNATFFDHFPMLLAPNKTLYAFSATVPATLEMFYTYY